MSPVQTRALLRSVELPYGAGPMALITLDNGDARKPTTFSPDALGSLAAALDEAEASGAVAVGLTGKPWMFCAGADLTVLGGELSRSAAHGFARAGHDVLRRLGELQVPTFAFVNGTAMGGGLEAALHCTYRTIVATARPVALPEVGLGLVPGWGGAWLLPNLVGIERAVEIAVGAPLTRSTLDGAAAAAVGLADACFAPAAFLEESLEWAAHVVRGDLVVQRPPVDRDQRHWTAVVAGARALVEAKLHGAAPAPDRCLDLLDAARTATRDEGFAAEDDALADLLQTPEAAAALYAFHLTSSRAKRVPAGVDLAGARPVRRVGVVGAGLMATQLALLFARRLQVPVVITDLDDERVQRGLERVRAEVDKLLERGRVSATAADRLRSSITGGVGPEALMDADLVIEAVFEDLAVKQDVLRAVEEVVDESCVLATNTSSLSVTAMGSVLRRPERLVGMHFFNPVSRMPLLEVVRAARTDAATLATGCAVGRQLGKSVVVCGDARGFVVNRLLTRVFVEIMRAVDDGTPVPVADAALDPLGLPMSPVTLLGLVGPAVQLHVNEVLHGEWPDRFPVSDNLRRLVDGGVRTLYPRERPGELAPGVAELLQVGDRPWPPAEVLDAVRRGLADEARRLLDEGVVAEPQDIDTAMILGAGWPAHLGGLTPYLDRTGISEEVSGRRFLLSR